MSSNNTELTREELERLLEEKFKNLNVLDKGGKDSNYIKELSYIALIQFQLKQYSKSEENYLGCLAYFIELKDRFGQASVYGVLGTLYYKKMNSLNL